MGKIIISCDLSQMNEGLKRASLAICKFARSIKQAGRKVDFLDPVKQKAFDDFKKQVEDHPNKNRLIEAFEHFLRDYKAFEPTPLQQIQKFLKLSQNTTEPSEYHIIRSSEQTNIPSSFHKRTNKRRK